MHYVLVILATYGAAAVIADAKAGPIVRLRERVIGLRSGPDWRYLWTCGMCVSAWVGAVLGTAAYLSTSDAWHLLTPAIVPGMFRLTAAMEKRHG